MSDRLERSTTNRVWTGVAGGIAEYFQIDPGVVRAFFVIATILTGGLFLVVYIALVILMPLPGQRAPGEQAAPPPPAASGAASESAVSASAPTRTPPAPERAERRREAAGWLLLALGVIFLLANLGAFRFIEWRYLWPLALIALGAFIILQRSRQ